VSYLHPTTVDLAQCQTQIAKWTAKRDRLIRDMRQDGLSLRQIAVAAGLSHTAVANIVGRA